MDSRSHDPQLAAHRALHISGETIAARLAEFVSGLAYDCLPSHVVDATKAIICDQLSVQLIGSTLPWVAPALDLVKLGIGAKNESTIVNHPDKYLAADAAFVNATYGQACEFDDSTHGSAGHIGTATVPVALAMGERERTDGRTLITSIVGGYEIMYRLMASIRPHHNTRGFHSQSIAGPFAAAAVAGKLINLTPRQLTHALAIAGSHSCGPLEFDQTGGEVKRMHAGLAARGGINSALLAQFGLTGPVSIIEGERGFCRLFSTQHDLSEITPGLGSVFNITNTWFKIYPATGPVHTAIRATERLVNEYRITSEMVARIRIGVAETSLLHGGGIRQPQDVLGAQFSFAYSVALQIVKGRNELRDYIDQSQWADREINELMDKIELYADLDARGERLHMATVTVILKDGRSVAATEEHPVGTPPNPATAEELLTKIRTLSRAVLSEDRVETLIDTIHELEHISDVRVLSELLRRE